MTHSPKTENRVGTMDEYTIRQLSVWADESSQDLEITREESLEIHFERLDMRKGVIEQKLQDMTH